MTAGWDLLLRITALLAGAAVAGLLARRFGQSTIVGYILAGVLLGPTMLGVVSESDVLHLLSEHGVALLLFAIGLEFSFQRLMSLGRVALIAGNLQVVITTVAVACILVFALPLQSALVIGMAVSLSSTAVVLRTLTDHAELDSVHGRNSLAILLMQDVAVVPVLIAVESMGARGDAAEMVGRFALRIALMVSFAIGATALARYVLPYFLSNAAATGNRDVPVLVAVCISLGATWSAHSLGFSPALGAFIAGLLLSESPFATQIRSDITPLTAAFVALFFTSVGTLAHFPLTLMNLLTIAGLTAALMMLKAAIVCAIVWLLQRSIRAAVFTALSLCQAGEFSFVLAGSARNVGLLSPEMFQLLLSVTLVTLVLTPYLIAAAPGIVTRVLRAIPPSRRVEMGLAASSQPSDERRVIVAGYGPAGQGVVVELRRGQIPFLVLELNPATVAANRTVLPIELGDAMRREVLLHARLGQALAFVVTPPDPYVCRSMIELAAQIAPNVPVIARSRYGIYEDLLRRAGSSVVVNEERVVGIKLAEETLGVLATRSPRPAEVNATTD